jgi:hypothetical protein
MQVYINYPNPHITIHKNASCRQIKKQQKDEQRHIKVRITNLDDVLTKFINEDYEFKSEKLYNDLWLDISLDNYELEIGVLRTIQAIIGQRYKPLSNAPITIHCE